MLTVSKKNYCLCIALCIGGQNITGPYSMLGKITTT